MTENIDARGLCLSESTHLNPTEHIRDVQEWENYFIDMQLTNLHKSPVRLPTSFLCQGRKCSTSGVEILCKHHMLP